MLKGYLKIILKAIHLYLNFPEKNIFTWLIFFYCTFNASLALSFMCASGIQCKADFFLLLKLLVILPFNWRNCVSSITNILTYFLSFWFYLGVPLLLFFLSSYFLLDWLRCYYLFGFRFSFPFNWLGHNIYFDLYDYCLWNLQLKNKI